MTMNSQKNHRVHHFLWNMKNSQTPMLLCHIRNKTEWIVQFFFLSQNRISYKEHSTHVSNSLKPNARDIDTVKFELFAFKSREANKVASNIQNNSKNIQMNRNFRVVKINGPHQIAIEWIKSGDAEPQPFSISMFESTSHDSTHWQICWASDNGYSASLASVLGAKIQNEKRFNVQSSLFFTTDDIRHPMLSCV